MSKPLQSTAAQWFDATEALGDDVSIRFGRLAHGDAREPEWIMVPHRECDGIGAFARLLRERGAQIPQLPRTRNSCRGIIGPLWRLWRNSRHAPPCAGHGDWTHHRIPAQHPPNDVAWHLFSEQETSALASYCRAQQFTLNSLLLKLLDEAVRPELGIPQLGIPWMIPVNLRGDVQLADDTENQISCLDVVVSPQDNPHTLHQQILHRLDQGEHRAKFLLMELGRFVSHRLKMRYLAKSRSNPFGNIGAFSNLGSWDPEKRIATDDAWLFCPPLVSGQRLAAGCLSFQNRLGLMIQAYPQPNGQAPSTKIWIDRWVRSLRNSLQNLASSPSAG